MPNPIVLGDTSGIAQGIGSFGSSLANALGTIGQQRREDLLSQRQISREDYLMQQKRQQELQKQGALQNVLQNIQLPPNATEEDIFNMQRQLAAQNIDPSVINALSSVFLPRFKEKSKAQAYYGELGGGMPSNQQQMGVQGFGPSQQQMEPQGFGAQQQQQSPIEQIKNQNIQRQQEQNVGNVNRDIRTLPVDQWNQDEIARALSSRNPSIRELGKNAQLLQEAKLKKEEMMYKRKVDEEKKKYDIEQDAWNYGPTKNYIETVDEEAKFAVENNQMNDLVRDYIKTHAEDLDPLTWQSMLAQHFGETFPLLYNTGQAGMKLLEKNLLKGGKALFGSQPTQREMFTLMGAQQQFGKTIEANLEISNLQENLNNLPIKRQEIKEQIIKENGNVPPRNLSSLVSQRMEAVRGKITLEAAEIMYKYGTAEEKKGAREILKENKSPLLIGKPMSKELKMKFYSDAGKDKKLAAKNARDAGYNPLVNE